MKAHYASEVSQLQETDYLRCSESFHNHRREDGVLFRTVDGYAFGILKMMFMCRVGNKLFPICLIHRLDKVLRTSTKDLELEFCCVRSRPLDQVNTYELLFARSVVRGAVLIPDYEHSEAQDYLVFDVLDEDIFVRCRKIFMHC